MMHYPQKPSNYQEKDADFVIRPNLLNIYESTRKFAKKKSQFILKEIVVKNAEWILKPTLEPTYILQNVIKQLTSKVRGS